MNKLSYDEMGKIFDTLSEDYFASDKLVENHSDYRVRLLRAFADGGWTEEEFDQEIMNRLAAKTYRSLHGENQ